MCILLQLVVGRKLVWTISPDGSKILWYQRLSLGHWNVTLVQRNNSWGIERIKSVVAEDRLSALGQSMLPAIKPLSILEALVNHGLRSKVTRSISARVTMEATVSCDLKLTVIFCHNFVPQLISDYSRILDLFWLFPRNSSGVLLKVIWLSFALLHHFLIHRLVLVYIEVWGEGQTVVHCLLHFISCGV